MTLFQNVIQIAKNKLRSLFQISGIAAICMLTLYGAVAFVNNTPYAFGAPPAQEVSAAAVGEPAVPKYINYQGVLRDAEGKPMSGEYKITFRIYAGVADPINSPLWQETHQGVAVRDGNFSVLLGNVTALNSSLFNQTNRFIGITVEGFDEMAPRQRFSTVPYAFHAGHANALAAPDGAPYDAVVVDNDGNIGIGATAPNRKVTIQGSGNAYQNFRDGERELLLGLDASGGLVAASSNQSLSLRAGTDIVLSTGANIEQMRVKANGRVGIGTANPQADLHVLGDKVRFESNGTAVDIVRAEGISHIDAISSSLRIQGSNIYLRPRSSSGRVDIEGELRFGNLPPVVIVNVSFSTLDRVEGSYNYQKKIATGSQNVNDHLNPNYYYCVTGGWQGEADPFDDQGSIFKVYTFTRPPGGGAADEWWVQVQFVHESRGAGEVVLPRVQVICFHESLY